MDRSSDRKREVLVEHFRKLGTPTANETFDAEFTEEINTWVDVNVVVSEWKTFVQMGYREGSQRKK